MYGGAFDPIHFGHLGCIELLLNGRSVTCGNETHTIDQVWVVPSDDQRIDKRCVCSQSIRLHLCRLAIFELNLHTKGVAVDTVPRTNSAGEVEGGTMALLDALSTMFPDTLFLPVIGSELLGSLPTWKQSLRLAQEATFIVIQRHGVSSSQLPLMTVLPPTFRIFDPIICSLPTHSSSSIRALLRSDQSTMPELSKYLPSTVAKHILDNQLYKGF